jgi:translation initiation factor IF-2
MYRRNHVVSLLRNGEILHTGPLGSLKIHTENVREVTKGNECGLHLAGWESSFEPGDVIECLELVQDRSRKLGRDANTVRHYKR